MGSCNLLNTGFEPALGEVDGNSGVKFHLSGVTHDVSIRRCDDTETALHDRMRVQMPQLRAESLQLPSVATDIVADCRCQSSAQAFQNDPARIDDRALMLQSAFQQPECMTMRPQLIRASAEQPGT